jgi:hypothetical protein
MKKEQVCILSDADFKRAVGVERAIFDMMVEEVKKQIRDFGRPPKLSRADQVLLTLMYWREYRTEFHIGITYGISESATSGTIRKIEDALIKSEFFHLSSGNSVSCRTDLKTVLLDASEQPVERLKKRVGSITAARKNASRKKFKYL